MARDCAPREDFALAAVCGLYCRGCAIYIATQEEPQRLESLARERGVTPESLLCDGCRAQRRNKYCVECKMSRCMEEKGITFCGDCPEYPCEELSAFQREKPHRIRLFEDLDRIREIGWEAWMAEKERVYSCPDCGTINSAYDPACRKCGHTPSCEYVNAHGEAVLQFLSRRI